MRLLLIAAAIGLAGFLLPAPTHAAVFSPPTFDFTADPGVTVTEAVRVLNDGAAPITLRAEAVNFAAQSGDEAGGVPEFYPASEVRDGRGLAPWMSFPGGSVTLRPGERGLIPFEVHIPPSADPGSHFGAVLVAESAPGGESGVGLVGNTALLVLLRVNGDVREEARVASFSVSQDASFGLPVTFQARVENAGTVHLRPFGEVRVRNAFGRMVASVPINRLEYKSVLPDGARRYAAGWEGGTFSFGPHTAELLMGYGTNGHVLTASARFWVLPWAPVLVTLAAAALLVILVMKALRSHAARVIRRSEQGNRA